jgi:hypothetical protein
MSRRFWVWLVVESLGLVFTASTAYQLYQSNVAVEKYISIWEEDIAIV